MQAKSQPYQSLFGKNSTSWTIAWRNLWQSAARDSVFVQKDTMVNGTAYKKLVINDPNYTGWLVREDTNSGKVWFRSIDYKSHPNPSDTIERLIFNFDLKTGDTFQINNVAFHAAFSDESNIVDSVKIINEIKHIYFRAKMSDGEVFEFIEGVGSNMGVIANSFPTIMLGQYLLCSQKDGANTGYVNKRYSGDCTPYLSVIDNEKSQIAVSFYPNPGTEKVYITSAKNITSVRLFSNDGRLLKEMVGNDIKEINIKNYPTGHYFVHLLSDDTVIAIKPLIIQQ